MKLDSIIFTNFKNFENLTIDLKPGVNLLVGTNGSGKTSFLEGICVAMGAFFGSQEQKMQRVISFDEIRLDKTGLRSPSASISAKSNEIPKAWKRTIKRDTKKNDSKGIESIRNYGKHFFTLFNKNGNREISPVFAYYSTQRLFKDAYRSQNQKYDPTIGRKNGYLECLEEKAIKPLLMNWLGNAATRRATIQIKEVNTETDHVLENVELAIKESLIEFLDLPDNFPLKLYQDPDFNHELFLQYAEDKPLPLRYYSDGFRNFLFLIIDLVWRASQLNPWLTLNELGEKISGVVAIDEVDLHLHPRWQGKVIPLLKKLFPEVQFFITTHSPTVVANFSEGNLYVIEDNQLRLCNERFFWKRNQLCLKQYIRGIN